MGKLRQNDLIIILLAEFPGDGKFVEGQIHSFIQQKGKGPRRDDTNKVAREMRNLTNSDIQNSVINISETGRITLK